MKKPNTRALAVKILFLVMKQGLSFQPGLVSKTFPELSPQDAAFVSYLCFGVLRFYFQLENALALLLKKPMKEKDFDLKILLLIGLFQVLHTDIQDHAIVHETVEGSRLLKKDFAKGFVNGILRESLRQKESLKTKISVEQSHPAWLITLLKEAWPNNWQHAVLENLKPPPFSLRVNLGKISREAYFEKLAEHKLTATLCPVTESGLILKEGLDVEDLPGFAEGLISVQDCAAQLATPLLDLSPKLHVLDACSAPGGKMAHILESVPDITLLAIEKDEARFALLQRTLTRLKLSAKTLCTDASQPELWFDGQLFDRILVDAPCSATGVIRRHPDILLHRQAADIAMLAKQQQNILKRLWPLLKPSGILLYVTCSLLPEENEAQIGAFLEQHPDAKIQAIQEPWGMALQYGRQILTGENNMDGFYYAKLIKT